MNWSMSRRSCTLSHTARTANPGKSHGTVHNFTAVPGMHWFRGGTTIEGPVRYARPFRLARSRVALLVVPAIVLTFKCAVLALVCPVQAVVRAVLLCIHPIVEAVVGTLVPIVAAVAIAPVIAGVPPIVLTL